MFLLTHQLVLPLAGFVSNTRHVSDSPILQVAGEEEADEKMERSRSRDGKAKGKGKAVTLSTKSWRDLTVSGEQRTDESENSQERCLAEQRLKKALENIFVSHVFFAWTQVSFALKLWICVGHFGIIFDHFSSLSRSLHFSFAHGFF